MADRGAGPTADPGERLMIYDREGWVRVYVWMVQVWDPRTPSGADGRWADYWPVDVPGAASRRAAVRRAPRVFCGRYRERYTEGSLRWRVGPLLRTHLAPSEAFR